MEYRYETLSVDIAGRVATLWLNRPEARNAVNLAMCDELVAFEQQANSDKEVTAVVIGGKGPVFCAGADLKERKGQDAGWVRERRRRSFKAYDAIQSSEKPHIAMIDGPLFGSGGEIAMACDFIYASTRSTFRFPEAQWGTVGATQRLPRRIGIAAAKELLLTARQIDAQEALRIGLVQRLFAPEDIAQETAAAAKSIGDAPALSIMLTKRSVDIGSSTDLTHGIEVERLAIDRSLAGSEWQNGIARFSGRSEKIGSDPSQLD